MSQWGHNWHKNLEFQKTLRNTLKKWPFSFQVYTKKIHEQFSVCREFKNRFICIISEVPGIQEFQEFVRSSKTRLFALSQNILKNIFIENYFNLIILKHQHSASRFAQQQNKLGGLLHLKPCKTSFWSASTNKQNRIKLLKNKQNRIKLLTNK